MSPCAEHFIAGLPGEICSAHAHHMQAVASAEGVALRRRPLQLNKNVMFVDTVASLEDTPFKVSRLRDSTPSPLSYASCADITKAVWQVGCIGQLAGS